MDWRSSYQQGIDDRREELRQHREAHITVAYNVGRRTKLAADLTDRDIEVIARDLAQRDIERVINKHNAHEPDRKTALGLAQ